MIIKSKKLLDDHLKNVSNTIVDVVEEAVVDFMAPYLEVVAEANRRLGAERKVGALPVVSEREPPVGKIRRRGRRTSTA